MGKALELLQEIIQLKNAPGHHDQKEHDPHKGTATSVEDVKKALLDAGVSLDNVPETTWQFVSGISNEAPNTSPNWKDARNGNDIKAFADPDTGIIHLNPSKDVDGRTIVHEIGHLVTWRGELGTKSSKAITQGYEKFIKEYEKEPSRYWADKNARDKYGLDGWTAHRNPSEFATEIYTVAVTGGKYANRDLAKLLGVPSVPDMFKDSKPSKGYYGQTLRQ